MNGKGKGNCYILLLLLLLLLPIIHTVMRLNRYPFRKTLESNETRAEIRETFHSLSLSKVPLARHFLLAQFSRVMPPRKKSKLSNVIQDSPSPSPSPSPEPEDEDEERFHFPSVRLEQPLIDTYTFHSVDHNMIDSEGKGKERANESESEEGKGQEWMLGVDEAGRGPALGMSLSVSPHQRVGEPIQ